MGCFLLSFDFLGGVINFIILRGGGMNLWEKYLSLSEEERDRVDQDRDNAAFHWVQRPFESYALVRMSRITEEKGRRRKVKK